MGSVNPVYYQYRSFENLYVVKVRSEQSVAVKIFDVSQKRLFNQNFSSQELGAESVEHIFAKGDFPKLLETLVQQGVLPRSHFSVSQRQVGQEECLQAVTQAIQQFKPRVLLESREMERFCCPITLQIFREPVIDDHGHTFEKSAIEEHRKRTNTCPVSREPIQSLTPNRLVQETIEEWQQRDPIPNLSLFQKANAKLATSNLQTANTYVNEGEYEEALEAYRKAFQYTKNWSHYTEVPLLFEKMEEVEKATLAYLYLACYQLQDANVEKAIETLERCQQGNACLQVDLLLIKLYEFSNQPEKAMPLAIQSADALSKQSREQAITIYKQLLTQYPEQVDLYSCLAQLLETDEEKSQTLFKGACHALERGRDCRRGGHREGR